MCEGTVNINDLKDLKDLGKFLNHQREKAGVKIEEIQRDTKIRSKYIHAMDRGEFSVIPGGDVYVRGFLKSYAEIIGLDSNKILQQYKNITVGKLDKDEIEIETKEETAEKPAFDLELGIKISIIALITLVFLFLVIRLINTPRKDSVNQQQSQKIQTEKNDLKEKPPEVQEQIKEEEEEARVTVEVVEETRENTTYLIDANYIEVTIEATDRCWISSKIDGNYDFEGILNIGDKKSFRADRDLTIRIGNPLMVTLTIDGECIGVPGGEARNFIFQRKN